MQQPSAQQVMQVVQAPAPSACEASASALGDHSLHVRILVARSYVVLIFVIEGS